MTAVAARAELLDAIGTAVAAEIPTAHVHEHPAKTGTRSRTPATVTIAGVSPVTLAGTDLYEAEIRIDVAASVGLDVAYGLGDQLTELVQRSLPVNWLELAGWDVDDTQGTDEPATLRYNAIAYGHVDAPSETGNYLLYSDTGYLIAGPNSPIAIS